MPIFKISRHRKKEITWKWKGSNWQNHKRNVQIILCRSRNFCSYVIQSLEACVKITTRHCIKKYYIIDGEGLYLFYKVVVVLGNALLLRLKNNRNNNIWYNMVSLHFWRVIIHMTSIYLHFYILNKKSKDYQHSLI